MRLSDENKINKEMIQLTKDHSVIQTLLETGEITEEDAKTHPKKNVITRAVGTESNVEADIYTGTLNLSETILICTDGLTNMVDDNTILSMVKNGESPDLITENLVKLAKENGGTDNITAVIIKASTGGEEKK